MSLSTNARALRRLIHRFPEGPHDSTQHPETANMRALHRYLRLALFAMVCLWVLTVQAPAVAAVRLPTPAGWPLSGSPVVQRGFDPPTVAWGSGHRGIDLAAKPGDAVLAAADGTVAFVGSIAGKPVDQPRPWSGPHHIRACDQRIAGRRARRVGANDRPSRSRWALSRLPALGTARGQEVSQPAASPRQWQWSAASGCGDPTHDRGTRS